MGWLSVSKQDLQRIEVLSEVLAGRRTTESAAGVLGMSLRQTQRLLARYRDGGGGALIHRSRGRPAVNRLAQKPENLHRSLHVKASQLTDILYHREQRHVGQQLTLSYERIGLMPTTD